MESEIHLENSRFGKLQDYLKEFVYGGIDGAVTTFAVVAGGFGANLDTGILLILGLSPILQKCQIKFWLGHILMA